MKRFQDLCLLLQYSLKGKWDKLKKVSLKLSLTKLLCVWFTLGIYYFSFSPCRLRLWAYKKDKLNVLRNIANDIFLSAHNNECPGQTIFVAHKEVFYNNTEQYKILG